MAPGARPSSGDLPLAFSPPPPSLRPTTPPSLLRTTVPPTPRIVLPPPAVSKTPGEAAKDGTKTRKENFDWCLGCRYADPILSYPVLYFPEKGKSKRRRGKANAPAARTTGLRANENLSTPPRARSPRIARWLCPICRGCNDTGCAPPPLQSPLPAHPTAIRRFHPLRALPLPPPTKKTYLKTPSILSQTL